MNCTDFRRSVTAYADGEFADVQDLEADRHLRTCPACAEHVADTTVLKSALKHAYGGTTAPPKLRDRILASLDGEVAAKSVGQDAVPTADGNGLLYRLMVPLGLAAALFLAVFAYWYWPSTGAHCVMDTKVAGRGPEAVRQQHRLCASHAADHHDPALTRDLVQIAQRLGDELSLAVIAPDLSSDGFRLMGADRCGIGGRHGAHVLYQATSDGRLLSVFTVARWPDLTSEDQTSAGQASRQNDDEYFVSTDGALTVVAWHKGPDSHAVCAPANGAELVNLVDHLRVVAADRPLGLSETSPLLAVAPRP